MPGARPVRRKIETLSDLADGAAVQAAINGKAPLDSPVLITPNLGTPSAGNLVNCTFPTLNQDTTGNAATADVANTATTATTLVTGEAINGVYFDGGSPITITCAAGTLTGTALNSTVTDSSLVSVGTILSGTWQGTAIADAYIASAASWNAKGPAGQVGSYVGPVLAIGTTWDVASGHSGSTTMTDSAKTITMFNLADGYEASLTVIGAATTGALAVVHDGLMVKGTIDTTTLTTGEECIIRIKRSGDHILVIQDVTLKADALSLGYYFFDPQSLADGAVTSWNGRIIGSDNGDVDKLATQATAADQPTSDGYKVTFADATDHLEIPSTTQAGWQVVATSKGTFVYRVNASAVTELTMLGNAGTYRAFGDLYGIMLLPESATNRDIEEARKLLIDRGALDAAYTGGFGSAWLNRTDIVEFKQTDFQGATNFYRGWKGNSNLASFSSIQATNCDNFTEAWENCSSLTQFPQDAKLGTEASNVNFSSAWRSSGLTSFSTPLPTATNVGEAWRDCTFLASFNSDLSLVINASYAWRGCTPLTSFSTELPLATNVFSAWHSCTSLTSFDTEIPLANNLGYSWYNCASLTDFSADVFANWNPSSISSGVFNETWGNCTSLTTQSVENILTSIDASGKYATSTGLSGGSALANATIDIDYDGTTLSAATNAAVTSLKSKGWSIIVNNVTL